MIKNKRAQLTIFIILAILIIAGVILFFQLRNKSQPDKSDISQDKDVQQIYDSVKGCIKETSYEAVYFISQNGGFYPTEGNNPFPFYEPIPIYLEKNTVYAPNISNLKDVFENYLILNINSCLEKSSNISSHKLTYRKFSMNMILKEDGIIITPKFPITLTKNNASFQLDDFEQINLETNFGRLYYVALNITDEYKNIRGFGMTTAMDNYKKYNITTNIAYSSNYTLVTLYDPAGLQNKFPLEFKFALA